MKLALVIVTSLIVAALFAVSGFVPGGNGIVAERTLPDGTKLMVVQKYDSGDLGYKVDFYFKEPGKEWGWCYLDHEDSRWRKGSIGYDAASDTVTISKGSVLRGKWDRGKRTYSRPDVKDGWSTTAPQEYGRAPEFGSL